MPRVLRLLRRRLLASIPVLLIVVLGTFLLLNAAGGDAVDAYLSSIGGGSAELAQELRQRYGIEGGAVARFLIYASGLLQADLGWSVALNRPVLTAIAERLPNTLWLMGAATALSFTLGSALGVIAGLVLGKPIGIVGGTWLITRLTRARLDPSYRWIDLFGVALLAGIGFTVSLLISELSFPTGNTAVDHAKVAVLTASVLAAALAAMVLRSRNRHYRAVGERDAVDADADGVPDVYQRGKDTE